MIREAVGGGRRDAGICGGPGVHERVRPEEREGMEEMEEVEEMEGGAEEVESGEVSGFPDKNVGCRIYNQHNFSSSAKIESSMTTSA